MMKTKAYTIQIKNGLHNGSKINIYTGAEYIIKGSGCSNSEPTIGNSSELYILLDESFNECQGIVITCNDKGLSIEEPGVKKSHLPKKIALGESTEFSHFGITFSINALDDFFKDTNNSSAQSSTKNEKLDFSFDVRTNGVAILCHPSAYKKIPLIISAFVLIAIVAATFLLNSTKNLNLSHSTITSAPVVESTKKVYDDWNVKNTIDLYIDDNVYNFKLEQQDKNINISGVYNKDFDFEKFKTSVNKTYSSDRNLKIDMLSYKSLLDKIGKTNYFVNGLEELKINKGELSIVEVSKFGIEKEKIQSLISEIRVAYNTKISTIDIKQWVQENIKIKSYAIGDKSFIALLDGKVIYGGEYINDTIKFINISGGVINFECEGHQYDVNIKELL